MLGKRRLHAALISGVSGTLGGGGRPEGALDKLVVFVELVCSQQPRHVPVVRPRRLAQSGAGPGSAPGLLQAHPRPQRGVDSSPSPTLTHKAAFCVLTG